MNERITQKKIASLAQKLGNRDEKILRTLREYKYMTTHHLRRLHFRNCTSELSALRSSTRVLSRLCKEGLITHLARRIGGVRAGSGAFIWTLASAGARLLSLIERSDEITPRKRSYEASHAFLEHTLARSEVYVRLNEMAAVGKLSLNTVESEPNCWRTYTGIGGTPKYLKPDLFAITSSGDYRDNWFWEIDRNTEAPVTVLRKCLQYISYYKTGTEQRINDVFPYVIWLVPDQKRRESLMAHIQKELSSRSASLFVVILMDELETLLLRGAEEFNKERTKL